MVIALLYVAIVGHLSLQTAAQGCSSLPDSTQVSGLIASNYQGSGQGTPPTITLQTSPLGYSYRAVCASSSGVRNQYRFVSIVAYYTSTTSGVTSGPMYGQFEFECVTGTGWRAVSPVLDNTLYNRLTLTVSDPAVNVSTMRTDCAYCLSPTPSPPRQSDAIYHCSSCSAGCSQPLCYTTDTSAAPSTTYFSQTCCNYFLQTGDCTTSCPQSSFPDANRTCIPCTLNCQNGGTLRSDMCGCICTAVRSGENCTTCLCQNGGTCSGTMCNCPSGYSGQLCEICILTCSTGSYLNRSTCSCGNCPLNCNNCSDSNTCTQCKLGYNLKDGSCDPKCSANCFNCTSPNTCTTCNIGYSLNAAGECEQLKQNPTGQSQSGSPCGGPCIGGIIGAILGVIVVGGIIAAVVAAVYFAMNNPAVATSAVPAGGFNGVAKDNPLYLDPKVVEDSVSP